MQVVHHNKEQPDAVGDLLGEALALEKNGEPDKAASLYLRYLKKIPGSEYAFSRLMIIYRKKRDYEKELQIINRGIRTFEQVFKKNKKITPTKKTIEISKKLMRSMGLADKKGREIFEREPLRKWRKRREYLLSKRK